MVIALAGYLVPDVHETVPSLLDSLEALDPGRITEVVEYFGEYAASMIVVLLAEDAVAVDDEYQRISEI